MENSRTNNSIRNIYSGITCKIIMLIFPLIIRNIIVYRLGVAYAGLGSLFTSLLNFLSLSELGLGTTIVYMMYEPAAHNDIPVLSAFLNLFKKIYIGIGIFILLIGVILSPFLPNLVNGNIPQDIDIYIVYYIYLANTCVSYMVCGYRYSLLAAFQRLDVHSKAIMHCYIITSIAQILVLLLYDNYYLYLIFIPICTIFQNITVYKKSKQLFPNISCHGDIGNYQIKEIISKTVALSCHKIGGTVIGSFDNIIISAFLGLELLGKYSNYYMIISVAMSIIGVYMNAILPSIGNYVIEKSTNDQYTLFLKLCAGHNWIVGWCTVCLAIFLTPVVSLWVGDNMIFSCEETIWMSLYFYFWQFRVLGCNFKDAAGLWKEDIAKPFLAGIMDVFLNIVFVKMWGVKGVLIATIACMLIVFFPFETKVLFKKQFHKKCKKYVIQQGLWALEWGMILLISLYVCSVLSTINDYYLLFMIPFCIIVPNLLFYIFNFKKEEYRDLFVLIKGYISIIKEK